MISYDIAPQLLGGVLLSYNFLLGNHSRPITQHCKDREAAIQVVRTLARQELLLQLQAYRKQRFYVQNNFKTHEQPKKLASLNLLSDRIDLIQNNPDLNQVCAYVKRSIIFLLYELAPAKTSSHHKGAIRKIETIEQFCDKVLAKKSQKALVT
jgi:hypothetical protein